MSQATTVDASIYMPEFKEALVFRGQAEGDRWKYISEDEYNDNGYTLNYQQGCQAFDYMFGETGTPKPKALWDRRGEFQRKIAYSKTQLDERKRDADMAPPDGWQPDMNSASKDYKEFAQAVGIVSGKPFEDMTLVE